MKFLLLLLALLGLGCQHSTSQIENTGQSLASINFPKDKIEGLSFVAPPNPYANNPMMAVKNVGADWIAIIPFAYTRQGQADVYYNRKGHQWWGERPEGVLETIRLAQEAGIKMMLKPQVYIPGSWPGGLDFKTKEEWKQWEEKYRSYIMPFVEMANTHQIELFCIGTEFKFSANNRPEFWKSLILDIRKVYNGQLTYAANWDNYHNISFWADLDFIGIDAYFPLSQEKIPTVAAIKKGWKDHLPSIVAIGKKYSKPVLFTEFGYLSVEGCAYKNWELESKVKSLEISEQAQANALQGTFEVIAEQPVIAGSFLWKWFPNMKGHEGYPERDYTPQGKLGELVLKRHWKHKPLNSK